MTSVFAFLGVFCASLMRFSVCDVFYNGQTKELSASSLTVLPNIPPDVIKVNIYNSNFSRIEANAFAHLVKCEHIKLWDNSIGTISNGAFNGLPKLTILYMWRNRITTIEREAFDGIYGLNNLRELKLWSNNITRIKSSAVRGFRNLVEMAIWDNDVKKMESRAVTWTNPSTTFNEWNNRITYKEDNAFYGPVPIQVGATIIVPQWTKTPSVTTTVVSTPMPDSESSNNSVIAVAVSVVLVSVIICVIIIIVILKRKRTMTCDKPPESEPQIPGKAVEPRYSNSDFPEVPDYCEIISDSHYDNVENKTNTYQKPDVIATAPAVYEQLHI